MMNHKIDKHQQDRTLPVANTNLLYWGLLVATVHMFPVMIVMV